MAYYKTEALAPALVAPCSLCCRGPGHGTPFPAAL